MEATRRVREEISGSGSVMVGNWTFSGTSTSGFSGSNSASIISSNDSREGGVTDGRAESAASALTLSKDQKSSYMLLRFVAIVGDCGR